MIASAAAFALMAGFVKALLPNTPSQVIILSRGLLMTAALLAFALHRKIPILGRQTSKLVLRGLLGWAGLSCYVYSVRHLALGDAVLLQYSHPVFVALAAPLLLGERTGRGHWPMVVGALAGVALVVGPQGDLRFAAMVGLSGAIASGLAYMTVRDLARTEHGLTILVWFPMTTIPGALVGTILAGREAIPKSGMEIVGHLAVFVSALVGQITLTAGLSRAPVARATAASLSGPVFGLLFGFLLFGTRPTLLSLVGAALVVGSLARLGLTRGEEPPRPEPGRSGNEARG
jgi:drug/metabolite transporter (DMT)-like permease